MHFTYDGIRYKIGFAYVAPPQPRWAGHVGHDVTLKRHMHEATRRDGQVVIRPSGPPFLWCNECQIALDNDDKRDYRVVRAMVFREDGTRWVPERADPRHPGRVVPAGSRTNWQVVFVGDAHVNPRPMWRKGGRPVWDTYNRVRGRLAALHNLLEGLVEPVYFEKTFQKSSFTEALWHAFNTRFETAPNAPNAPPTTTPA